LHSSAVFNGLLSFLHLGKTFLVKDT
jgi:hypothetical protein